MITEITCSNGDRIPVHCEFTDLVPVGDVIPNPSNLNQHSPNQISRLAKLIKGAGFRQSVTVSTRSDLLCAGHGRRLAALELGCTHLPVDFQGFKSEKAERDFGIADNFIASLATIDEKQLAEYIVVSDGLNTEKEAEMSGYTADEIADIIATLDETEDEEPENPSEDEEKPLDGTIAEILAKSTGLQESDLADYEIKVKGRNPKSFIVKVGQKEIELF